MRNQQAAGQCSNWREEDGVLGSALAQALQINVGHSTVAESSLGSKLKMTSLKRAKCCWGLVFTCWVQGSTMTNFRPQSYLRMFTPIKIHTLCGCGCSSTGRCKHLWGETVVPDRFSSGSLDISQHQIMQLSNFEISPPSKKWFCILLPASFKQEEGPTRNWHKSDINLTYISLTWNSDLAWTRNWHASNICLT